MVELQHLRLWSLFPSGIDDLLFERRQFRVANNATANHNSVDPLCPQSLPELGQSYVR